MNRTKLPIRKRLGDVPQFSRSTDAAIAEVGTTNRLGFQLLMYQIMNPRREGPQVDEVKNRSRGSLHFLTNQDDLD
ncbi:hypothetical protein AgCh_037914 [Apium graveolens]